MRGRRVDPVIADELDADFEMLEIWVVETRNQGVVLALDEDIK